MTMAQKKGNSAIEGHWVTDRGLAIFRIVAAIISVAPVAVVLTLDPRDFVFYLTDWGLMITCLYFWYMMAFTVIHTRPNSFSKLQKHLKVVMDKKVPVYLFELCWSTRSPFMMRPAVRVYGADPVNAR